MLKYKGPGKPVNSPPEGEWVKIHAENLRKERWKEASMLISVARCWTTDDWKRTRVTRPDQWYFDAWISLNNYEKDIEDIKDLIRRLKVEEDVYVVLLDYSRGLERFANWLRKQALSHPTFNCKLVLKPEKWKEWLGSHQIKKEEHATRRGMYNHPLRLLKH